MGNLDRAFAVLFLLLLIHGVSAERVDTDLSLTVQCTNSTYANLTYAKYVSDSMYLISSEKQMTKNGIFYNYTLTSSLNNKSGTIEYGYRCDVNGEEQSSGNRIFVSLMGDELSSSHATLYIIIFAGLLFIFILTFYGAMVFPWRNGRNEDGEVININDLKYLKVVLFVFIYLESIFIITIMKNISGYLLIDGTYSFFRIVQTFLLIGMLPFFPLLIFFTIMIWINDKKVQKNLQRGIPVT